MPRILFLLVAVLAATLALGCSEDPPTGPTTCAPACAVGQSCVFGRCVTTLEDAGSDAERLDAQPQDAGDFDAAGHDAGPPGDAGPRPDGGRDTGTDAGLDAGPACDLGDTEECYSGPPGTAGVGSCHVGLRTCISSGGANVFGPCTGEVTPVIDTPGDGMDDDCNTLATSARPRLAFDGANFALLYNEEADIETTVLLQRISPAGVRLGDPVVVHQRPFSLGRNVHTAIGWNGSTEFGVTFTAKSPDRIMMARYDATGAPVGAAFNVVDSSCGPSRIEWNGTRWVAAFADGGTQGDARVLFITPGGDIDNERISFPAPSTCGTPEAIVLNAFRYSILTQTRTTGAPGTNVVSLIHRTVDEAGMIIGPYVTLTTSMAASVGGEIVFEASGAVATSDATVWYAYAGPTGSSVLKESTTETFTENATSEVGEALSPLVVRGTDATFFWSVGDDMLAVDVTGLGGAVMREPAVLDTGIDFSESTASAAPSGNVAFAWAEQVATSGPRTEIFFGIYNPTSGALVVTPVQVSAD